MKKRIIVIGGGMSGLWAALSAARKRQELKKQRDLEILLINKTSYHSVRVRNHEADLDASIMPLAKLLEPTHIKLIVAEVSNIDVQKQSIAIKGAKGSQTLTYDALILAAGSQLIRPNILGLAQHGHDIDNYENAKKLQTHLNSLPDSKESRGKYTAVVVGGGFTGLEIAAELPSRLKSIAQKEGKENEVRVIIMDRNEIGHTLGEAPNATILKALKELGVETMPGKAISAIVKSQIELTDGEKIPAQTVIWTGGQRANALCQLFNAEKDKSGRILVDEYLQIPNAPHCFASGDSACAKVFFENTSLMSCQHGQAQGKFAGYNAVASLYDKPMKAYQQPNYVTVLDMGPWGAIFMEGWERKVVKSGTSVKALKQSINHQLVAPPMSADLKLLLDLAEPMIRPLNIKFD